MGDARVIFFLLGRSAGARGQTRLLLPSQALRASSPGGRAKFTLMDRGKLCGKMNFFAALPYHKLCRN